jgi:hypothetical protein
MRLSTQPVRGRHMVMKDLGSLIRPVRQPAADRSSQHRPSRWTHEIGDSPEEESRIITGMSEQIVTGPTKQSADRGSPLKTMIVIHAQTPGPPRGASTQGTYAPLSGP